MGFFAKGINLMSLLIILKMHIFENAVRIYLKTTKASITLYVDTGFGFPCFINPEYTQQADNF